MLLVVSNYNSQEDITMEEIYRDIIASLEAQGIITIEEVSING